MAVVPAPRPNRPLPIPGAPGKEIPREPDEVPHIGPPRPWEPPKPYAPDAVFRAWQRERDRLEREAVRRSPHAAGGLAWARKRQRREATGLCARHGRRTCIVCAAMERDP